MKVMIEEEVRFKKIVEVPDDVPLGELDTYIRTKQGAGHPQYAYDWCNDAEFLTGMRMTMIGPKDE